MGIQIQTTFRNSFLGELSTKVDQRKTIVENPSTIVDLQSTKVDSQSTKVENPSTLVDCERPKPSSNGHSEASTSITTDPSLSLLYRQRETDERVETIDPEFEGWLTKKASQLPQQPALLNQWIESEATKKPIRGSFRSTKHLGRGQMFRRRRQQPQN